MALKKYNVLVTMGDGETELIEVDAENSNQAKKKALDLSEKFATAGTPVLVQSTSKPPPSASDGGLTDDAEGSTDASVTPYGVDVEPDPGANPSPRSGFADETFDPTDEGIIEPDFNIEQYTTEQDKKFADQMAAFNAASEQSRLQFEAEMARMQRELDQSREKALRDAEKFTKDNVVKYEDPESKRINEAILDFANPTQTEESRQRQLEGVSPFGAFLEQLEGAGLGNLTGAAGRFAKSQYQPLRNEYDLATLMPLIMNEAADGWNSVRSGEQGTVQGTYLDALRRANTSGGYDAFTGDEAALQREADKSKISEFAPTFGSFVGDRVQGGARASQLRQLAQLQQLSGMSAAQPDNAFASGVLNPASGEDAELLFQLANQGMAGRYFPLAQQAISRYGGSSGEAFADYTSGNLAAVGQRQSTAPTHNFAKFLGERYGLF